MADLTLQDRTREGAATRKLPIGKTISLIFSVVGRARVKLYAIALVITLISVPTTLLLTRVTAAINLAQANHRSPTFPPGIFGELGAVYLLQILVSLLAFGTIADLTSHVLRHERSSLGGSLKVALVRFASMLLSALIVYTMMLVGLVSIIVPGIIVGAVYGLAPTLCVVERLGPFASLSRSADLTRSNRLRCVALTALIFATLTVVGFIIGMVGAVGAPQVALVTRLAWSFLSLPFLYVYSAVLVSELKQLKDGGAPPGVRDVF